jgi:hypothetical protein
LPGKWKQLVGSIKQHPNHLLRGDILFLRHSLEIRNPCALQRNRYLDLCPSPTHRTAPPLTGRVRDQAELHGLLSKIRDLNLALLAVITQ